jgi:hypothetical protein
MVGITHGLLAIATTAPVELDGPWLLQFSKPRVPSIEEQRSRERKRGRKSNKKAVVDTNFSRAECSSRPNRLDVS